MTKEEIKKLLAFISVKDNANGVIDSALPKQASETIIRTFSYNEKDNFIDMWKFVNKEAQDSIADHIAKIFE